MRLSYLVASLAIASANVGAGDLIDQWEGVYVVPGKATAKSSQDGPAVKVPGATDCLVVKRVTANRAEVYLASIQALGYACYLEGTATLVDGKLEFKDEDAIALVPGERATLYITAGVVKVASSQRGASYCGIHAGIEGIAFPTKSRKALPPALSASGAELSSACPQWGRP